MKDTGGKEREGPWDEERSGRCIWIGNRFSRLLWTSRWDAGEVIEAGGRVVADLHVSPENVKSIQNVQLTHGEAFPRDTV